jgi:hypothetical protein
LHNFGAITLKWLRPQEVKARFRLTSNHKMTNTIEKGLATVIGIARTSQYYDLNEHPARLFICRCTRFDRPRRSSMSAQRGSHSPQTPASWIHQLNADLPVFDISTLEARTMPTSWREREYCRAAAMTFIGLLPACRLFVRIVGPAVQR